MWFKEYLFNVLIQPFHFIIYTILVGSAIELATTSLIYAVVAIYFLIPAEKLLRKFFGFDNAGTLSAAGSFAGGALFSAMINKVNRPKPPHEKEQEDKPKPRKASSSGRIANEQEVLFGGVATGRVPSGGMPSGGVPAGGTPAGGVPSGGTPAGGVPSGGTPAGGVPSGGTPAGGVPSGGTPAGGVPSGGVPAGGTPAGGTPAGGVPAGSGITIPTGFRDSVLPKGRWDLAKKGLKHRVGSAARSGIYSVNRQIVNKAKTLPKSAGRFTRRTALGAIGAGTLGMLALGAGAATGDPTKALGLATAAGSAGYNFANFYGDKITKGLGAASASAKVAFWGSDLSTIQKDKFDREFKKNPETYNALEKVLGSRKAVQTALEDGTVQAFLNNNITDPSKIAKALKLRKEFKKRDPSLSDDELLAKSVSIARWHRDLNPGIFAPMSTQQNAFKDKLIKQLKDSGQTEAAAKNKVDEILGDLAEFEM